MFRGVSFLLKYTWKFEKKYIIYSLSNQFLQGIVMLMGIIIPGYIIDSLLNGTDIKKSLIMIIVLVVGNFVGRFLGAFLTGKCFALKGSVYTQFQTMMTEKLSKCDFSCLEDSDFLDDREKAKRFLYANGQGFGVVMDSTFDIIGKLFTFLGIISVLATLNVVLVIFFVILIMINTVYESKTKKKYFDLDMRKAPIERRTNYLINLIEDFSFGKEIRLFGLSEWLVKKVKNHLNESNNFYVKQVNETIRAQYFSAFFNMLLEGVAYIVFAFKTMLKEISIGEFSIYVSAMLRFSTSMQDVMKSILDIKQFSGYYDALVNYMNVTSTVNSGKNLSANFNFEKIKFENVSFKYPGQKEYSLKDVNVTITSGEKVAIVGENGAGKTTFIKLLCRLYNPTEGKITIDGIDIRDINFDEYVKLLGPVFQDYKLFSFSIKDNVCLYEDEEDDVIVELLNESGLKNTLNTLKNDINTFVYKNFDESGFEPSGGEGQKIAIARAVYKDAPLVILDEPTSALDPRAEYDLYNRFHNMVKGKTAIFISHRMASCKFCDRIILFENGNILECGSHEELMKTGGKYYEMFSMQAQYYI